MNNHKHVLREIAKFAAGLITADLIVGLWILYTNSAPFNFFGLDFSLPMMEAWAAFDIILLAVLIHYAWHADVHTPSMKQRTLFIIVGIILGLVGIAHFLRIVFGIDINISGWTVPFWPSWIGTIVALYLSYSSFRFSIRSKK